MFNNPLRKLAIAATLLATAAPVSAMAATQSVSGSSTVTVSVPDVIILDYFTKINLGLAGQAEKHDHGTYSQADLGTGDQSFEGRGALSSDNLTEAGSALLKGSDVNLTLRNVWAVRGFSSTGNAKVSITGPTTLTQESGSSSIGVSKLQVMVDGEKAENAATSVNTTLKGIQKSNAVMGDILMGLNFTNTSVAGDYTGTVTITAVTM
jgi:hypothetical protein